MSKQVSLFIAEGKVLFLGRKSEFDNYWDLFWHTGMPEAFGVYRLSKNLFRRKVDENGAWMPEDPPLQDVDSI